MSGYTCVAINELETMTKSYCSTDKCSYRFLVLGPDNITCLILAHCVIPYDSINSNHIIDDAIKCEHIADDAIKSNHIADKAINSMSMIDTTKIINKANGIAGLDSTGRIRVDQLPMTAMNFLGTYDPSVCKTSANLNSLATSCLGNAASLTDADYFIASKNGSLDSTCVFSGDWVIYNKGAWSRVGNSSKVISVNGKIGDIDLSGTYLGINATAANSTKLGGTAAACYALKSGTVACATNAGTATNAECLGETLAECYALKTDTVANANCLGTKAASCYALKTGTVACSGTATNAECLGGTLACNYALKAGTVANADRLGLYLADCYALKTGTVYNAYCLNGFDSACYCKAHTHKYAGSESAGGVANSAAKISTNYICFGTNCIWIG